ncbi:hypothetical protein HF086_003771 [Spodoptera exigua]|uniref:Zinc finger DNA binding protein n=1 Tax=Spodoptera exigua TaxID=7107 RepID=A0A922MXG0_SPOEX|nr:hypothetical protein HF086_003771 [Spodoptera exigua]
MKTVQFLSEKYDEFLNRINILERERNSYLERINSLQSKVDLLERTSRASMIEIRNVPKQEAENKTTLSNIVKTVGEVLSYPIADSDIRDVIRTMPKKNDQNASPILVEFTTVNMKDNVIKKTREFNKKHKTNKINTTHLKLAGLPKPIYIAESLTTSAKQIYYHARQMVSNKEIHSSWTSFGRIFIKTTDSSKPLRIDNLENLRKFRKEFEETVMKQSNNSE